MSSKGAGVMGEENSEKSALVPRQRFPQFSEAWKADRIGKIAEIFKGKGIAKSDISNDGIYPCIRYGELYTVYGELVTKVLSRTSLPATELFFGESNDVIIPSSGETKEDIATATCVIPGGIAFGGDLNVLRTQEHGAFLSYYLNGPLRQNIARVAQGDSVVHLYPHQIEKLPIAVPPDRNEQQKIADCLSSLDELITAETEKLDTLKTHKKGLMQQLFPREGETVPRLRFREFREEEEWEQTALGLIAGFQSGGTPSKANPAYWNGSIPWVSAKDMKSLFLDDTEDHITTASVEDGAKLVEPGGLLILTRGMTLLKDIPICVLNRQMSFNQDVKALLVKGDTDGCFLAYLLLGNKERLLGLVDIAGHGTGRLDTDELKSFKLTCPQTAEQQKIADCLSSLDDLITAQNQKIDALKTHKKGLMQQLFPVLDEVPG